MEITKEEFDKYFKAYCPILIKKASDWNFVTSAGGGFGISLLAASGGLVQLRSPSEKLINFHYFGAGAGWSFGGRLPKIPKLPTVDLKGVTGVGSTTDFDSYGTVQITEYFEGHELTASDLAGPCVFIDGGGGVGKGGAATFFLLGISPLKISMLAVSPAIPIAPVLVSDILLSAKAVLVVAGVNVGAQVGGGISANLGYLRYSGEAVDSDKGPHPAFKSTQKKPLPSGSFGNRGATTPYK